MNKTQNHELHDLNMNMVSPSDGIKHFHYIIEPRQVISNNVAF